MAMNIVWVGLFVSAFLAALWRWLGGEATVFPALLNALFDAARSGFELSLGLDNAATPLGLQAMRELQTLNPEPDRASDAQIMFVVLNTAGLTLIPSSVIAIRQSVALRQGLTHFNAADIFLPTLLVTLASLLAGLMAVAVAQRLPVWRPRFLLPVLGLAGGLVAVVWGLAQLSPAQASQWMGSVGVRQTRHALSCALVADVVGLVAAIGLAYALWR